MKRLFTLSFVLLFIASYAQIKLQGSYCSSKYVVGFYSCLTFKNDSLFEYYSAGCFGRHLEHGTYKRNWRKLKLNFILDDSLKNSFAVQEKDCNQADSVIVGFMVTGELGDTILGACISVWDITSDSRIAGTFTWTDGKAALKLKKEIVEREIYVSLVGYRPLSFKLKPDKCMNITVCLKTPFYIFENGTQLKCRIKWPYSTKLLFQEEEDENKYTTVLTKE